MASSDSDGKLTLIHLPPIFNGRKINVCRSTFTVRARPSSVTTFLISCIYPTVVLMCLKLLIFTLLQSLNDKVSILSCLTFTCVKNKHFHQKKILYDNLLEFCEFCLKSVLNEISPLLEKEIDLFHH